MLVKTKKNDLLRIHKAIQKIKKEKERRISYPLCPFPS